MISLNKNPGIWPIGVGEVIHRIAGKFIIDIAKKDVQQAAGSLQVCAGQDADVEASIYAMHDLFQEDETEAVLLVDAENAFSSINRKAMLHNISITCPTLSIFVSNCYLVPVRLFILRNREIKSREGTTQGDPTVMVAHALWETPLIHYFRYYISMNNHICKEEAFADNLTIAGKIERIRSYWELLQQVGPLFGYFPRPSKTYLVVKEQYLENAIEKMLRKWSQNYCRGEKYLGAAIGSEDFKSSYVKSPDDNWIDQLKLL